MKRAIKSEEYIKTMAGHYMVAAHWTEGGPDNPEIEDADFSEQAKRTAYNTCRLFYTTARHCLHDWPAEQAGHDLWLTRNGHGTGFWDRDRPGATNLDNVAVTMGPANLYRGDDGLLYFAHN